MMSKPVVIFAVVLLPHSHLSLNKHIVFDLLTFFKIVFHIFFRRLGRTKQVKETRFFAADGHVLNINQGK